MITPPFDRVEVTIRGYNGKEVLSVAHMWTKEELTQLDPYHVSTFVAARVTEMTQAMTCEVQNGGGE